MAIKLTVSDAVEKSFNIENLELRKKLIIKYMSTETFKKSVLSYLELIKFLGCDVENICESKFDLFDYSIEKNNKFLQENNINYKVYYKTEINNTISFIELSKTN
jgi:hypothetical protein